jgi:DNA-binding NtrC family response regulator
MARKHIILHLENEVDWINEVKRILSDEYDVRSARTLREATMMLRDTAIDAAVIDISLVRDDANDVQGEEFMDALEAAGILPGNRIIVLSAHLDDMVYHDRMRRYFRDFDTWDVMKKQTFKPDELKKHMREAVQTPFLPDA